MQICQIVLLLEVIHSVDLILIRYGYCTFRSHFRTNLQCIEVHRVLQIDGHTLLLQFDAIL